MSNPANHLSIPLLLKNLDKNENNLKSSLYFLLI